MLVLTKKQLKSVLAFAAKIDVRFYLNGIYFDGQNLVATNGAAIAVITDTLAKDPKDRLNLKYFISFKNVESALSKMKAKDTCELDIVDGVACIRVGDSCFCDMNSETNERMTYKYPDFERVICKNPGAPDGFNWYNPDYLKALQNLVMALNDHNYWTPEGFTHNMGCLGVRLLINPETERELLLNVAIMPMRLG